MKPTAQADFLFFATEGFLARLVIGIFEARKLPFSLARGSICLRACQ